VYQKNYLPYVSSHSSGSVTKVPDMSTESKRFDSQINYVEI